MALKTILVSLNNVERVDQIADVACQLANKHDAHLIGLFVTPMVPIFPVPGAYVLPAFIENYETLFRKRAAKARSCFERLIKKYDLRGEWRQVDNTFNMVAEAVMEHGHQADLVVIGQIDPNNSSGVDFDFTDYIIMDTGRPVLVVPYSGKFSTVGEKVVVGWNATRETARATFDALPILKTASRVWITWIDPQRDPETAGQLPGAEMATALSRHNVNVTAEAMPTADRKVGDALLSRVSDHKADLLVIGAYGHSRLREFVFGGATRDVLNQMTIPVLMSC